MNFTWPTHRRLTLKNFFFASLLAHFVLLGIMSANGHYEFSRPITGGEIVNVALDTVVPVPAEQPAPLPEAAVPESAPASAPAAKAQESFATTAAIASSPATDPAAVLPAAVATAQDLSAATLPLSSPPESQTESMPASQPLTPPSRRKSPVIPPPLRTAGEFLQAKAEKLTYRLSMFGMPVGDAILEAKNVNGEVNISLKVNSNAAFTAVYPVDDLIETRHVAGNFIISKIRQYEGGYQSQRGFTLLLRDKNAFWIDLKTQRSSREPLPNTEVVDLLSGFYYLRKQPLAIGQTITLHVYDSDAYQEMPVQVVRREQLPRPVGGVTTALVVRPSHAAAGVLRHIGEVLVWLSDDDKRVPLRIETAIPLGRLTAELIAAEVERDEQASLPLTLARGGAMQ